MNDDINDIQTIKGEDVTPKDLLKLARYILLGLSGLFIIGILSEYIIPDKGIFEACKVILPPIATSVIGFYYSKSN